MAGVIGMEPPKGFVKARNPCAGGFCWFLRHYPQGSYQPLLDARVADGRVEDGGLSVSALAVVSAPVDFHALMVLPGAGWGLPRFLRDSRCAGDQRIFCTSSGSTREATCPQAPRT